MLKRYNRLLVAVYVFADALSGAAAFLLAYLVRFSLMPAPKGRPSLDQYLTLLPFIALLVPLAFRLQGLYRLRRGRSRVDDFFAVLIGNIWAVLGGVAGTLYFRTYYLPDADKARGMYEVSQAVWIWFLVLNI